MTDGARKFGLPSHIRAAIFDLDGTLLDSMGVWEEVGRRFFARRGIVYEPEWMQAVKPMGLWEASEYTKARYGLFETPQEILDDMCGMMAEEYAERVPCKRGAAEYLECLRGAGYRLGVATASGRELFLPALERLGILNYFSTIVTTREVSRGKEFPDIYLLAAENLGVAPENCAVFEDVLHGIRSAKVGGFYAVAIEEPTAADDREDILREADLYVPDFVELMKK